MKLTISPSDLKAALSVAAPAVGKGRFRLPVLEMVLLAAHIDGGVTVTGTDTETRAWHTVPAQIEEAGAVCLPPKALLSFLDAIPPDDMVTLVVDAKHKAQLTSGQTMIRLAGLDSEEFPIATDYDVPTWDHTMGADVLALLIESTVVAAAKIDNRAELNGVLFEARDCALTLTAADGHRLATRSVAASCPDLGVIVHASTLRTLPGKLRSATSARLLVDGRESSLLVDTEAGCWSMRLVEGRFPDYERIIPREAAATATVDRADLERALRLTRDVEGSGIVRFSIGDGSLRIYANGQDDRAAEDVIPAETTGELVWALNGGYALDAVSAFGAGRVTLAPAGNASPLLLTAEDEPTHRHVLMPMHTASPGA